MGVAEELSLRDKIAKLIFYQQRPDVWAKEVLGANLYDYQNEILLASAQHDSVAVHTGHGVGKTLCAAIKTLHHMFCYADPKVITTAPTQRQVEGALWPEIHYWLARVDYEAALWEGSVRANKTKLVFSPDCYAIGITATDPAKLEGYHARNILFVVDEAKAVPDPVFVSIEGALTSGEETQGSSRRLYISTPGQPAGRFYEICMRRVPGWVVVHVSGEQSPRVSRAWIDERRDEWGEDSYLYRTRVLGLFDDRAFDSVIPYSQAVWCGDNPRSLHAGQRLQLGVDVARSGPDRTCIAVAQGDSLLSVVARHKRDAVWTAETVMRTVDRLCELRHLGKKQIRVVVDDIGLGGGVTDMLRRSGYAVTGFVASGKPYDETKYKTRRDELWFEFAARVKRGEFDYARIQPKELRTEIAGELASVAYNIRSYAGNEVFIAEPKHETKKRLGRSPDLADAILLAFAAKPPVTGFGHFSLQGAKRKLAPSGTNYEGPLEILRRG